MQNDIVDHYEADKLYLRQLEDVDNADEFKNHVNTKTDYYFSLLLHIELFNPHTEDESFMKKIQGYITLILSGPLRRLFKASVVKK